MTRWLYQGNLATPLGRKALRPHNPQVRLPLKVMAMLPNDTAPKVAQMQIELIRQMSPARRFALMASWSQMLLRASYQEALKRHSTEREARIAWVRQLYGNEVADRLEKHL